MVEESKPNSFQQIQQQEQYAIEKARPGKSKGNFVGLAFSGGGIRSATFNLGVIQALAELKLLRAFDYLSTVSGGGYIGCWLTALMRRQKGVLTLPLPLPCARRRSPYQQRMARRLLQGAVDHSRVAMVEQRLSPYAAWRTPPSDSEAAPIRFLRRYSNYLTPKWGVFSADTWQAIAIYVRNLLLNQLGLVTIVLGLLLSPYLLAAGGNALHRMGSPQAWLWASMGGLCLTFIWVCGRAVGIRIPAWPRRLNAHPSQLAALDNGTVLWVFVLPILVGALMLAFWLWLDAYALHRLLAGGFIALGALSGIPMGLLAVLTARATRDSRHPDDKFTGLAGMAILLSWIVAGAVFGICLEAWWRWGLLGNGNPLTPPAWLTAICSPFSCKSAGQLSVWWVLSVNVPWLVLASLLAGVIYVGLAKRAVSEMTREWLGRLGGWLMLLLLGWTVLFALILLGPAFVLWLQNSWLPNSGIAAWLGSTLLAVLIGNSAATNGGANRHPWLDRIIQFGPYLFLVGLSLILEYGIYNWVLGSTSWSNNGGPNATALDIHATTATAMKLTAEVAAQAPTFSKLYQHSLAVITSATPPTLLWWLLAGCAAVFVVLNWRLDANALAFHQFYRNRLTRAYLGASRARQPSRFTDLDPYDDILLGDAIPDRGNSRQVSALLRPLHLINTTVNLMATQENAWQYRKGASFVFSPLYCGYEISDMTGATQGGYRATQKYMNGVWTGTAMAVSGAAANPNMGYHSSPAMTALLTVFNVRLGRWCPNTTMPHKINSKKTPRWAIWRLLQEMFGNTHTQSSWLNLSDGGHFENLGLYELVRRGCRYIVVCDAGADPEHSFEDLANAIRKCYTDLGIEIDIDLGPLRPLPERKPLHCAAHYAVGTIHYDWAHRGPRQSRPQPGKLIYLKASLTDDEDSDIRQYSAEHPDFPHQSTADQWFDEPQFESYRKLGHHIALELFLDAKSVALTGSEVNKLEETKKEEVYRRTNYDIDRLFEVIRQPMSDAGANALPPRIQSTGGMPSRAAAMHRKSRAAHARANT